MSKMLTDWFAGKEISTAMAIFVTSWPVGVALSLLALPVIGSTYGVGAVYLAVVALIGLGIILLGIGYPPPDHATSVVAISARLDRGTTIAVVAAGLIWGLYNAGFATIFSFGPAMLAERGWSIAAAGSAISIVLWLGLVSVPAGGFLADRTGRPQSIIVAGSVIFAVLMVALPRSDAVILTVFVLGLLTGLPAGPIMSLPARLLQPATRAIGMGLFYTVYYAVMMLGPVVGGGYAKWAGHAAAAFDFGAALILACPVLLWGFNRIPAAAPQAA
jgi:MFS family permease